MKTLLASTLIFFMSFNAIAGTGGFYSKNCMSASGRTIYTYVATDSERIINLIVDGMARKYVDGKNVSFSPDKNMLLVVDNKGVVLSVGNDLEDNDVLTLGVREGRDPRIGTEISNQAKVEGFTTTVKCKTFSLEP